MSEPRIVNGLALLPEAGLVATDLHLADGRIAAIGGHDRALALDANGLMVPPGIVDIHDDAFERQIQPRPDVGFPIDLAPRDTETQMLANGITLSWEPGLRGLDA